MLPSIFGENLFDDFFSDPFGMMVPQGRDPLYGKHAKNLMKTDVRETEDSYELDIDLPGFKKDEVSIDLKNGCLTIQAAKGLDKRSAVLRDGASFTRHLCSISAKIHPCNHPHGVIQYFNTL